MKRKPDGTKVTSTQLPKPPKHTRKCPRSGGAGAPRAASQLRARPATLCRVRYRPCSQGPSRVFVVSFVFVLPEEKERGMLAVILSVLGGDEEEGLHSPTALLSLVSLFSLRSRHFLSLIRHVSWRAKTYSHPGGGHALRVPHTSRYT